MISTTTFSHRIARRPFNALSVAMAALAFVTVSSTPLSVRAEGRADADDTVSAEFFAAMEAGQMPLDQLLDSYRRGAELLQLCRSRLDAIEAQVQIVDDGQLKPWITP